MQGTYDNFNVSATLPESGHVWTVAANEDGTMTITNVEKKKFMQYDASYNNFAAYETLKATYPFLIEASNPTDGGSDGSTKTTIVLDVTENAPHADFPVGDRISATLKTYNIGGYDWSFYAPGYFTYFDDSHVVLLGKKGAYITLPAVEGKALKSIDYLASEGASASVELGVFEGDSTTAVAGGESKVATKGETTTWTLSGTKAGVRYNLRVTNDKNTQFQKITLIYE